MGSPENPSWMLECPLIDDITVSDVVFGGQPGDGGFYWEPRGFSGPAAESVKASGSYPDPNDPKESGSRKRSNPDSCNGPASKACREKLRRDKLNDKFMELGVILEPGKTPKMDKAGILTDAARMITNLRSEAQKLKDSNQSLQEKIDELKTEKNELRDEKQRLKAEKENLEQQIKAMSMPPSFLPYPPMMPCPFISPGQVAGSKLMMPYVGHPGVMFQFQSPANAEDKNELPPAA